MFTFALIVSLACLAVPVSIYLRMVATRRSVTAQIHARMPAHRTSRHTEATS